MGLEEKNKREEEREAFFKAHREALEANQKLSVDKIEDYEKEKIEVMYMYMYNESMLTNTVYIIIVTC